jgi:di/tricarboxylate transporter
MEQKVVEAVVLPDSRLNDRIIGELELNRMYDVKIMGVQHQGRQHIRGLRSRRIASGDVLLLQGDSASLNAASDTEQLMMVEGIDDSIPRRSKNWQALLIMLAVILLAALSPIPIVVLALTGAGLMIVTKCLRADEALRSLEPRALLLLAAAIPMGHAMETTGLAQAAVDLLLGFPISSNPVIFVSLFYLLVNLLAQFISAKAVAVLFTPIALSLAASMGVNPTTLLMVIAFATAAGFLTPMGHQVNAIVMGPGSYTFGDYIRIGLPMTILMWVVGSIFIPIIFPL